MISPLKKEAVEPVHGTVLAQRHDHVHRWGVILAGGDGKRLLPLTRRITGDDRPKQFCALTGGETLLNQTRRRVARMISEQQIFLMLTRTHERFYANQVSNVAPSRLLVQPYNHGTAPAITYSLMRLHQIDAQGVVAFFPSDHHFQDDGAFAAHVQSAFEQAEAHPERVILLGIVPDTPEESYGWIEPGAALSDVGNSVTEVRRFWEKPSRSVASGLMRAGGLWNSFVMVGKVSAFLNLIRKSLPDLIPSFESLVFPAKTFSESNSPATHSVVTGTDLEELRDLYSVIPASNFSEEVLSRHPAALAVLRADALGWSDLGEPQRVLSALKVPHTTQSTDDQWMAAPVEIPA